MVLQRTRLSRVRTPDPEKLWDSKCVLFWATTFAVICYIALNTNAVFVVLLERIIVPTVSGLSLVDIHCPQLTAVKRHYFVSDKFSIFLGEK